MQDERNTDDREEAPSPKKIDYYDPWQQAFREEMKRRQDKFDF